MIAYALWPRPVEVQVAVIDVRDMRVTVDEDGITRIREKYVVSAPLEGRLARVTLDEGDRVIAGDTVLAAIDPVDPALLDPRARAQADARIKAAEATLSRAQAEVARAYAALELVQTEFARVGEAFRRNAATQAELDDVSSNKAIRSQECRAAEFASEFAQFELELARAALLRYTGEASADIWRLEIRAPVQGRVLRVFQESASVVQPGTPLIEVGDPADMEVVVDVLSRDAVNIEPGAPVTLEHWGGDAPLNGRVRLVEPAAFMKVSALGVEEQRVNVLIDLTDPLEMRSGLGDGYRVEARILAREINGEITVPSGALFRQADSWAVYVIQGSRAVVRPIQIGLRSSDQAQVITGLQRGDVVVLYPSDRIQHGVRVTVRPQE